MLVVILGGMHLVCYYLKRTVCYRRYKCLKDKRHCKQHLLEKILSTESKMTK